MHSSLHLIARANAFLDELALGSGSPAELRRRLEGSLRVLIQLKEEMLFHGFAAPFIGITRVQPPDEEFASAEEARDLSKQIARMRYVASLKKFTLARTRIAIAAHKAALGELEHGLRPELLQVLPLDGNYIGRLTASREHGLHAYHALTELLADGGVEEGVSVVIEHAKDGSPVRARFNLSTAKNLEEKVKRAFGESARILSLKPVASKGLVRRRSARVCLASAYAVLAASQVEKELAGQAPARVAAYASLLKKHGLEGDALVSEVDGYEELKEELAKNGLLRFEAGEAILDEEVASYLSRRRRLLRERAAKKAKELLALDLLKFFLLVPRREREKGLLFPSLPPLLSKESLAFLEAIASLHGIRNAAGIVAAKLKAEELKLNLGGRSFGSAFFYLNSDKPVEWCEKNFGLPRERILAAARTLAPLVEAREERLRELGIEKSARAREFAEALRDAGSQGKKG
ncbi:MAG: DUF530 family protein [Candidatus Micrarchaeia archaeon]